MKKLFKYLFLTLLLCIIGWLAFNSIDEELAPGIEGFFYEEAIDETKNGLVVLAGMTAPAKNNPHSFGQKALEQLNTASLDSFLQGEDPTRTIEPNELSFIGESRFGCWISQTKLPLRNRQPCASKKELLQMIADNKTLLERYRSLQRYPRFVDNLNGWENGQLLVNINELFLAKLALSASQGGAEKALKQWIADTKHWQRVIEDKQSMVGKAIVMLVHRSNLEFLPALLQNRAHLARKYKSELLSLLTAPAFGKGGWNMISTMQAEYANITMMNSMADNISTIMRMLFYRNNATQNKFYYFAKDMVELSQKPASRFALAQKAMNAQYQIDPLWKQLIYNPIGNLIVYGISGGSSLIESRHRAVTYSRMLALYVRAKSRRISSRSMPSFITNSGKESQNPLTEKPFEWNSTRKSLSFDAPGIRGLHSEIFF